MLVVVSRLLFKQRPCQLGTQSSTWLVLRGDDGLVTVRRDDGAVATVVQSIGLDRKQTVVFLVVEFQNKGRFLNPLLGFLSGVKRSLLNQLVYFVLVGSGIGIRAKMNGDALNVVAIAGKKHFTGLGFLVVLGVRQNKLGEFKGVPVRELLIELL